MDSVFFERGSDHYIPFTGQKMKFYTEDFFIFDAVIFM